MKYVKDGAECETQELRRYDNDYDLHIADIVPTWKDYKKLYKIK